MLRAPSLNFCPYSQCQCRGKHKVIVRSFAPRATRPISIVRRVGDFDPEVLPLARKRVGFRQLTGNLQSSALEIKLYSTMLTIKRCVRPRRQASERIRNHVSQMALFNRHS